MSSPDITVQAIIKEHPDHYEIATEPHVTFNTDIAMAKEIEEDVFYKNYVYVNEPLPEAPAPAVAPFNMEAMKVDEPAMEKPKIKKAERVEFVPMCGPATTSTTDLLKGLGAAFAAGAAVGAALTYAFSSQASIAE